MWIKLALVSHSRTTGTGLDLNHHRFLPIFVIRLILYFACFISAHISGIQLQIGMKMMVSFVIYLFLWIHRFLPAEHLSLFYIYYNFFIGAFLLRQLLIQERILSLLVGVGRWLLVWDESEIILTRERKEVEKLVAPLMMKIHGGGGGGQPKANGQPNGGPTPNCWRGRLRSIPKSNSLIYTLKVFKSSSFIPICICILFLRSHIFKNTLTASGWGLRLIKKFVNWILCPIISMCKYYLVNSTYNTTEKIQKLNYRLVCCVGTLSLSVKY